MKSNYKLLGDYIQEVNIRNSELKDLDLLGISIQKEFIPSIANTIGTDMSKYKIVKKNQFAYGTVTSRNGDKISIALLQNHEEALISQAYISFEVIDENELLPEYLMMWFRRPEFDRYARYMSYGSAREVFSWEEMCNVKLPVPSIEKQREIVKEYNTILNRIQINENMIEKLECLCQSIYTQWFEEYNIYSIVDKNESCNIKLEYNEELEINIPNTWKVMKLNDLCDIKGGKRLPKGKELNNMNGNPYIKVANMSNRKFISQDNNFQFVSEDIQKSISRYIVSENDIIISIVGTIGLVNIVAYDLDGANLTENCAKLTNISKVSPNYLYHYIKSPIGNKSIETKIVGGVQGKLPLYNIADILVVVPEEHIVNEFDRYISKINKIILNYTLQNIQLLNLKEILLEKISIT